MKQYCQYHPTRPAHWYCDQCGKLLCPECVETRDKGGYRQGEKLHMCPNCNIPVQWLGVANIIDPFWKRLPQFFLYPFSFRPLVLMGVLSVLATLLTRPGIVGSLAAILVWGVTLKYAYAILQSTAGGDLTAPPLNSESLWNNFGPVLKQFGIYIAVFMGAGFVFVHFGSALGGLFIFLATLFIPAMVILLVTTESLFHAINPMMFVRLATRIGWGYLAMYFFCSILGGAPAVLGRHIIQYLPGELQLLLFTLVKIYYTFISYHLMGYVILQYHEDIGYHVDFEDFKTEETAAEAAMAAADDPQSRLLRRVHQLIKDGDHEGARAAIESEIGEQGISDLSLSERYYLLLKMTGATDRLVAHGCSHLDLLVGGDKRTEAMTVYRECLQSDPGFSPASGSLFKLGGWFNETGKSKEAIGVFNKLTKVYPRDPLVPKAYFRAAQIFNDRLLNPAKARKILTGLVKKFPDHDIIPFVERYLGEMG
jgi:tetratricopeptide (TPR) repeat protein